MRDISILLIDDHGLFRKGIELLVRQSFSAVHYASFATIGAALDGMAAAPDLVLLDLNLEGIGGLAGISLLKMHWPACVIIVVTSDQNNLSAEMARREGAADVIIKSAPPEQLIDAIRGMAGTKGPSNAIAPIELSARQLEVLQLVSEGHSNKSIARLLTLSEFTVRGHVQFVLKSLGASNRTTAVFRARETGLL